MAKTDSVRYVGRYDAVEVRRPDGSRELVEHDKTFTTTPEHAASLLTQEGEWEPARASADKKEG